MDKIMLNDLLNFKPEEFENIKCRFNKMNGKVDPMEDYLNDPDKVNKQWLFWRENKRFFKVGQIAICFLQLSKESWLLTTIKKVTNDLDIVHGINNEGEILTKYEAYFGRLIIHFHKEVQQGGLFYNTVSANLEVQQILPSIFDGADFPGYDKVMLSYSKLAIIINSNKRDWVAALESQKAVYLITDTSNGKLYVGSANSNKGMLLTRWRSYIKNGHGGNTDLVAIVNEKGFDYIKKNFQYSILENYNSKVEDSIILQRESWWKKLLLSGKFGYNNN
jgi:hypothetical protein